MERMTPTEPPAKPHPLQNLWKEWLEPAVFAIVITQFVATLVGVDGNSMMPGLRDHERVLVPKYETWLHKAGIGEFKRGDILVFKPPRNAPPELNLSRNVLGFAYRPFLIKRLIGLPGDKIFIKDGEVTVNGKLIDQSWITDYWKEQQCWDTTSPLASFAYSGLYGMTKESAEITVPAGSYFVMGDNRSVTGSEDSRLFGVVERRDVAGRAAAVIWPPMRKVSSTFDCNSQKVTELSGETKWNMRFLGAPTHFVNP